MNQRSPSNGNDETHHRLQAIMAVLVLAFLLLLLRLWYLQVIEGEHFAALSENNRIRIIPQRDIRGQILDRNSKVLVDNRPSFTLSVLPEETSKLDLLIPRLKNQLPIRWEEVEPKLKMAYAYRTIQLAKDLTREQVAYVAEHRWDLPGVLLDIEHVRQYPYGELAAHSLGYIGEISEEQLKEAREFGYRMGDYKGQAGAEKFFERMLRGEICSFEVEVAALGPQLQLVAVFGPGPAVDLISKLELRVRQTIQ